jgi:hypothetical protein
VSVSSAGAQGNGQGNGPSISGNGAVVAFESAATNLAAGHKIGATDVLVRDRAAGTTIRVSVSSASVEGDDDWVAFASEASTLVPNDTNRAPEVFVRKVPQF